MHYISVHFGYCVEWTMDDFSKGDICIRYSISGLLCGKDASQYVTEAETGVLQ